MVNNVIPVTDSKFIESLIVLINSRNIYSSIVSHSSQSPCFSESPRHCGVPGNRRGAGFCGSTPPSFHASMPPRLHASMPPRFNNLYNENKFGNYRSIRVILARIIGRFEKDLIHIPRHPLPGHRHHRHFRPGPADHRLSSAHGRVVHAKLRKALQYASFKSDPGAVHHGIPEKQRHDETNEDPCHRHDVVHDHHLLRIFH